MTGKKLYNKLKKREKNQKKSFRESQTLHSELFSISLCLNSGKERERERDDGSVRCSALTVFFVSSNGRKSAQNENTEKDDKEIKIICEETNERNNHRLYL